MCCEVEIITQRVRRKDSMGNFESPKRVDPVILIVDHHFFFFLIDHEDQVDNDI